MQLSKKHVALFLVKEEVKEDGGAKKSCFHLWQAARGEVDDEAVAVLGHVGGGLRDGSHLLPLHVADDKASLVEDI